MEFLKAFFAGSGFSLLIYLTFKSFQMESKFAELKTEFDGLKEEIASEREQVKAKLDEQDASIARLEEAVANGGTAEEIQLLIDDVKAARLGISKIYEAPGEEEETDNQA
jgi:hypothetical protein